MFVNSRQKHPPPPANILMALFHRYICVLLECTKLSSDQLSLIRPPESTDSRNRRQLDECLIMCVTAEKLTDLHRDGSICDDRVQINDETNSGHGWQMSDAISV